MATLKIKLVKSTIGAIPKHRKTVQALGLRKLNQVFTRTQRNTGSYQKAQARWSRFGIWYWHDIWPR